MIYKIGMNVRYSYDDLGKIVFTNGIISRLMETGIYTTRGNFVLFSEIIRIW